MKYIYKYLIAAVLFLLSSSCLFAREMSFDIPRVEKFSTSNGVSGFYIKDDLPRTTIFLSIGYGRLYESSQRAGTGALLARVLEHGGSKKFPGLKLRRTLENVGGEISITSGWENTYISIEVLSKHSALAWEILKDVVENPLLDGKSIAFSKRMMKEELRHSLDKPDYRAFSKVREIIYGGEGYGAVTTAESIDGISVQDLKDLMNKYFVSGNMSLAIASMKGLQMVKRSSENALGGVERGSRIYYKWDNKLARENVKKNRGKIFLIPMKLKQATIVKGTLAPNNRYEGKYTLDIMNYILGGGSFTSRLMQEIRVKRGLAYSVFSLVRKRYGTGIFLSFAQTRNSAVGTVLSLFDEAFKKIYTGVVSPNELKEAVNSIKNSYVFKFSRTSQVVANFLNLHYYGFHESYFNDYLRGITSVKESDIEKEARKLLQGGTITVVVGDESLKKQLGKYGRVVVLK